MGGAGWEPPPAPEAREAQHGRGGARPGRRAPPRPTGAGARLPRQLKRAPSSRRKAHAARGAIATVHAAKETIEVVLTSKSPTAAQRSSAAPRVGRYGAIVWTKPGAWFGSESRPPPNASGKKMIWATARAAFIGSAYPIARPMNVNGIAPRITAPRASRRPDQLAVAAVNSQPMMTTGSRDSAMNVRPDRMRPANAEAGPAG